MNIADNSQFRLSNKQFDDNFDFSAIFIDRDPFVVNLADRTGLRTVDVEFEIARYAAFPVIVQAP